MRQGEVLRVAVWRTGEDKGEAEEGREGRRPVPAWGGASADLGAVSGCIWTEVGRSLPP